MQQEPIARQNDQNEWKSNCAKIHVTMISQS